MVHHDTRIDVNAEEAVIGMMLDGGHEVVGEVIRQLGDKVGVFGKGDLRVIYKAIVQLMNTGVAIDKHSVGQKLDSEKELGRAGGKEALETLQVATPAPAPDNVEYYVNVVRERAVERGLLVVASSITATVRDDSLSFDEKISRIEKSVYNAIQPGAQDKDRTLESQANDALEFIDFRRLNKTQYNIPTGFPLFDQLTLGLHKKELAIVGGTPSLGKSAFVHSICRYILCEKKLPVIIFDYESSAEMVLLRMASAISRVNLHSIRSGEYKQGEDYDTARAGIEMLKSVPLVIPDKRMNITQLAAYVRRAKHHNSELAVVVVDHLQLVDGSQPNMDLRVRVTEVSAKLKEVATTNDVAVVAISQLRRDSNFTATKEPMLYHLRESGAIEQDADAVYLLWQHDEVDSGRRSIKIAKQRNGPVGTLPYMFTKSCVRFEEANDA